MSESYLLDQQHENESTAAVNEVKYYLLTKIIIIKN
jgi:hypothetical protein